RGPAALVPAGHRALALPVTAGVGAPSVVVGDRVDVLAAFDMLDEPDTADVDPAGVVTAGAVVVDVGESAVTVAVPEDDAPRVAFAAARGTVTLALVGAD
ncbi:MAG: RcpC/CpaB family pilus assembly protein, partial [Acidimicrobiales bacterium]